MSMKRFSTFELVQQCPSCRDGATSQRAIYQYALAYLCDECREWWLEADRRAYAQSKGQCPHHPERCVAERPECVNADMDQRSTRLGGSRS